MSNKESPPFTLKITSYGGRSLFATRPIPENSVIHISQSPCAHVIYREYRRFVCAWCFAYFGEERSLPVSIDSNMPEHSKGPEGKPTKPKGNGERFCSSTCKDLWLADAQRFSGFRVLVDNAINGAIRKMKSQSYRSSNCDAFEHLHSADITQAVLDTVWKEAIHEAPKSEVIILNEMEQELARFVASGLPQLHAYKKSDIPATDPSAAILLPRSVLDLQDNELPYARRRPYIVASHIRIYKFLRTALSPVVRSSCEMFDPLGGPENGKHGGWVRAILSRDTGNSFGIRDNLNNGERHSGESGSEEKEMFGWGLWADASFFNHGASNVHLCSTKSLKIRNGVDCKPNLSKTRLGRSWEFRTTRAIESGEELCISYVNPEGNGSNPLQRASTYERRKLLLDNWYFGCACERCNIEAAGGLE